MTIYAVGADSGEAAAWALVSLEPGSLPVLVHLAEVYGSTDRLWLSRARDGAFGLRGVLEQRSVNLEQVPCWVEVPPAKSRASGRAGQGARHSQVSWSTLGVRAGGLWMAWWCAAHVAPDRVEPGQWWASWGRHIRRGKNEADGGRHRIDEASRLVRGSAIRLAEVASESRRVDCAESILIAGAAALALTPQGMLPMYGPATTSIPPWTPPGGGSVVGPRARSATKKTPLTPTGGGFRGK